jgi:hypothetical protein
MGNIMYPSGKWVQVRVQTTHTRILVGKIYLSKYVINEQNCTLLVKNNLIYITNKEIHALLDY